MNKGEFIDVAKRMVKEYFNRYVNYYLDITVKDVIIINYKATSIEQSVEMITKTEDRTVYRVHWNNETKELSSDISVDKSRLKRFL